MIRSSQTIEQQQQSEQNTIHPRNTSTSHLIDELWPLEHLWLKSLIVAPGHHSVTLGKSWGEFV